MKKAFLIVFAVIFSFVITGCTSEEQLSEIPTDNQGKYLGKLYKETGISSLDTYYGYEITDTTFREKLCLIGWNGERNKTVNDCDFDDGETGLYGTDDYDIKNITKQTDDDTITFEAYDGDEKKFECIASFGEITCTRSNGSAILLRKES